MFHDATIKSVSREMSSKSCNSTGSAAVRLVAPRHGIPLIERMEGIRRMALEKHAKAVRWSMVVGDPDTAYGCLLRAFPRNGLRKNRTAGFGVEA